MHDANEAWTQGNVTEAVREVKEKSVFEKHVELRGREFDITDVEWPSFVPPKFDKEKYLDSYHPNAVSSGEQKVKDIKPFWEEDQEESRDMLFDIGRENYNEEGM